MSSETSSAQSVSRFTRGLLVGIGITAVLTLIVASVLILPSVLVDRGVYNRGPLTTAERLKAENDIRVALLQGIAGIFFLVTAVFTARQLRVSQQQLLLTTRQTKVTEEKQLAELFSEGLRHLGTTDLSTRLGGVYVLDGVAKASSEYVNPVAEVLCGVLRAETVEPVNGGILASDLRIETILEVLQRLTNYHGGYGLIEASALVTESLGISGTYVGGSIRNVTAAQLQLEKVTLIASTVDEVTAEKVAFNGATAVASQLRDWTCEQVDMRRSNLVRSTLSNHTIEDLMLQYAVLVRASLVNITAEHADSLRANLTQADLRNIHIDTGNFRLITLVEGRLVALKARVADFTGSDLSRAELSDLTCKRLIFEDARLTGARLSNVTADYMSLAGCKVVESNLRDVHAGTLDLSGTSFSGCHLEGVRANEVMTSSSTVGLPGHFTEGATAQILSDGRFRLTNFVID